MRQSGQRKQWQCAGQALAVAAGMLTASWAGAQVSPSPGTGKPAELYKPIPGFDQTSLDATVDPCTDFYKFACGHFFTNHPIPPDEPGMGPGYVLQNVNTQELRAILEKSAAGGSSTDPDAAKIGSFYQACMDTAAIERDGLAPVQPLLTAIDGLGNTMMSKLKLPPLIGQLQRDGVDVFFSYGEQQDFKDATRQIALAAQGGLGLPEKDYYLRTGDHDEKIRQQYVAYITTLLTLAGSSPDQNPDQARRDADGILRLETALARGSMGVVDLREPEKIYHMETTQQFAAKMPGIDLREFLTAVHSPAITELNDATPDFFPALVHAVRDTDMPTLKAYMRYHVLSTFASQLPKRFDDAHFDFYGRTLRGQPEQEPRWRRCSQAVDHSLGEALGRVYVEQYFAGDSKAKVLEIVHDVEHAMDADINQLDWMSPATKARAKEKLAGVADKIGYPDKWRDYGSLDVKPADPVGNLERANAFESDRQLNKIGKPVDHGEFDMSPPTVNAYYNPSMNDINFPAGILQPPYFDRSEDDAVNYGQIGAAVGHELTHGFDDQGRKFDAKGNLSDWWTPEDAKRYVVKTDCLVGEYGKFTAVDDVKVNGQLTLGENTADNGGLVLAYLAYLDRARKDGVDLTAKKEGYTAPQRFYIGYAQSWCENARPESVRAQVLADPHAPDHFRVDGAIVNQPGFAPAFGCKSGSPMVPVNACRVW